MSCMKSENTIKSEPWYDWHYSITDVTDIIVLGDQGISYNNIQYTCWSQYKTNCILSDAIWSQNMRAPWSSPSQKQQGWVEHKHQGHTCALVAYADIMVMIQVWHVIGKVLLIYKALMCYSDIAAQHLCSDTCQVSNSTTIMRPPSFVSPELHSESCITFDQG